MIQIFSILYTTFFLAVKAILFAFFGAILGFVLGPVFGPVFSSFISPENFWRFSALIGYISAFIPTTVHSGNINTPEPVGDNAKKDFQIS